MSNETMNCCHINSTFDFTGEWEAYQKALINYFYTYLYNCKVKYEGLSVSLKRNPVYNGLPGSFFHITCIGIGKDAKEEEREPDLRRCERLHWIKPIIEKDHSNCPGDCVRVYEKRHGNDNTINFLFEEGRFLVVLAKRNGYLLLKTAFYIEYDNRLKREIKAYEEYRKQQEAP